jgi:hypothetical protein
MGIGYALDGQWRLEIAGHAPSPQIFVEEPMP